MNPVLRSFTASASKKKKGTRRDPLFFLNDELRCWGEFEAVQNPLCNLGFRLLTSHFVCFISS